MKANVMFYHTDDTNPKVLDRCGTMVEARGLMRRYAKNYSGLVGKPTRTEENRIEFRCDGWGMSYYVEPAE